MKKIALLFTIPILLISCSDNDPRPQPTELEELGNIQVFEPAAQTVISNPYGRPTIFAEIDGERFMRGHPDSFDGGLLHIIRTQEYDGKKITFSLKQFDTGTYILGDSTGFTQAFYNNIPCSHGVLRILSNEGGRVFASFEFVAGDHRVNNGFIYDVLVEESYERGQNHEISARINGEKWEAKVFGGEYYAASFVVRGYNEIGNVRLDIHASSFSEPGIYDLLDNPGFNGVRFTVAKEEPVFKSGSIRILSAGNGNGVRGTFNAEFEGYSIRNGRFHLMK